MVCRVVGRDTEPAAVARCRGKRSRSVFPRAGHRRDPHKQHDAAYDRLRHKRYACRPHRAMRAAAARYRAAVLDCRDDSVLSVQVGFDLHLGHERVIDFANRPFSDAADQDTQLWRAWTKRVGRDDVVVVAGDLAMGPARKEATWARVMHAPGRKVLVVGNHDVNWREADWREAGARPTGATLATAANCACTRRASTRCAPCSSFPGRRPGVHSLPARARARRLGESARARAPCAAAEFRAHQRRRRAARVPAGPAGPAAPVGAVSGDRRGRPGGDDAAADSPGGRGAGMTGAS